MGRLIICASLGRLNREGKESEPVLSVFLVMINQFRTVKLEVMSLKILIKVAFINRPVQCVADYDKKVSSELVNKICPNFSVEMKNLCFDGVWGSLKNMLCHWIWVIHFCPDDFRVGRA